MNNLARITDLTLLGPTADAEMIRALIAQAQASQMRGICIAPSLLHAVTEPGELVVGTVCGYPTGKHHVLVKAAEARLSVQYGATDVALVPDQAADPNALIAEIAAVREAVPHPVTLGVVFEPAFLGDDALTAACRAALTAGADYLIAATDYPPAGDASVEAVRVMRAAVDTRIEVKANAGARSLDDAQALVAAGAGRLGMRVPAGFGAGARR